MSQILRKDDDAKAITIPRVFSENSRAKNVTLTKKHYKNIACQEGQDGPGSLT